ncbi:hypothetical protein T4E_4641 [Trichinella pseudospiralis]|uniref:Uncharacterized protein n=1 Tax=Trichinella pseudospiralis TaxID=6337 RepID=A0A0V0XQ91_TRIPS|nr:hypothetical protein T4E_4641 [Trichinella pseudospiralis]
MIKSIFQISITEYRLEQFSPVSKNDNWKIKKIKYFPEHFSVRSNHFKVASTVMQMSELFGTRVSSGVIAVAFAFEINCNLLARNQKENNNKTKGKMHNQQATLAHDSFVVVAVVVDVAAADGGMVVLVLLFSKQHCREEKLPLKVIIVSFAWFVPDAAAKVDQTRRISNWPLSIKIIESAKQMQTQVKMSE